MAPISEFEAARKAAARQDEEYGADGVYYDSATRRVVVSLPGEMLLTFPPYAVQGLDAATEDDLRSIQLVDGGVGLRVERLDVDISIPGLLKGMRGTAKWEVSQCQPLTEPKTISAESLPMSEPQVGATPMTEETREPKDSAGEASRMQGAPLASYSPEDQAFYRFWYGHMVGDLMQPPLSGVSHATARYIWNAAKEGATP